MALVLDAIVEILRKPSVWSVVSELLLFVSPIWIAVLVGLLVGWAWKPKWAAGLVGGEHEGSGSPRTLPRFDFWRPPIPGFASSFAPQQSTSREEEIVSRSPVAGTQKLAVSGDDLVHLWRLVEETDGGPLWHQMMDKTLPSMSYKAWRRDTEDGPPQYRSRTIFEDATPEVVRDFFGDDEFRMKNKWDDMLIYHNTLEECPTTGTMVVHWVRKFPFFCSDREYTIGRRIWVSQRAYYCVTKGVPSSTVPRRNKPRRVDLYYSSWCIRAVESRRGDGQMTACEVLLFHYEDMGIPREIAKLGIRQGMWGCVRRIEPGLRAYQTARMNGEPLSPSALAAQINTKFNHELITSLEANNNGDSSDILEATEEKPWGGKIPKLLLLGGAVALACTFDQGLLTKAVIFGVARRFVRQRKGL
ncbi:uncharacterized protein LOC109712985 [Ananas comosus]|uniref:Uncharacterized protein LOC109712985 n=2 Tax=Ananas comosus TaxID=4615 RepID=A0A6P5F950_ANACO|nr:uncharacterized protein LOC109712985 [Ananas comosus]